MKALEFTTKINEGVIHIPENMRPYYNSRVRIIILAEEADISVSKKEKLLVAEKIWQVKIWLHL